MVIAGDQAYQDQNLALALEKYLQAIALQPDKHPPQLRVAEIYYQLQEYEKARDAFVQYLELEPTDRNAHNYLGYIYESLQNSAQAAEQFEQSLRLYDQDLYALNHLGLAYKQLGQYQQAEETLRQALAIDPKCERTENRNLHNYLALIYQASDQTGEAIAELRESIRLFPEETWARTQVATLYENHGRYDEAQLQYAEILKVEPDNLLAQSRLQALSQARATTTIANVVPVDLLEIDTDAISYIIFRGDPNKVMDVKAPSRRLVRRPSPSDLTRRGSAGTPGGAMRHTRRRCANITNGRPWTVRAPVDSDSSGFTGP